jgi:hypothetical protein
VTDAGLRRRGLPCRRLLLTAVMLTPFALAACSGGGSPPAAHSAAGSPSIATPLATSLETSAGSWATVPMGHLDQPLNTFWQLLFRPAASKLWANQVQATAVATNGGVILASTQARAILAGIRPSNLLTFSPLILTADSGRTWSTGLLPAGLAARPDSLAANSPTQALALVEGHGETQVLASAHGISAWHRSTTAAALAATPAGRSCGLDALTAVAYATGRALLAGGCARAGVIGIFAEHDGSWQLLEGAAPDSLARARVQVLALQAQDDRLSALLGVAAAGGESLIAASRFDGVWRSSAPLRLRSAERVSSLGQAAGAGIFVVLMAPAGAERLAVASAASGDWQVMPALPTGTATVAFGPASSIDALAVNDTVLTVWSLDIPTHAWARAQVIKVPLEFDSSE